MKKKRLWLTFIESSHCACPQVPMRQKPTWGFRSGSFRGQRHPLQVNAFRVSLVQSCCSANDHAMSFKNGSPALLVRERASKQGALNMVPQRADTQILLWVVGNAGVDGPKRGPSARVFEQKHSLRKQTQRPGVLGTILGLRVKKLIFGSTFELLWGRLPVLTILGNFGPGHAPAVPRPLLTSQRS